MPQDGYNVRRLMGHMKSLFQNWTFSKGTESLLKTPDYLCE